ncbi:glutathione s-transferase [Ophiostoma piceae UAMH 11346]|uniref:Glutathione s-transferase n=1 Tax=Ophiostoma piceae (strain UAMH 11346) TaxID=1262450 RepID=S3BXQ7_OPHP1|nr:glutathione s-transferase [Ophiostoma piceae UAMH 11346]
MAKLTLYTNHRCPWAHRAHIALAELGVPFDEVIIDLNRPRDPWYLADINPRGLVPSLKYVSDTGKEEIVTESAIVSQFLVDLYGDKTTLEPASNSETGAIARARINFFVDTYFSKVQGQIFKLGTAKTAADEAAVAEAYVAAVAKELEPLLAASTSKDAPFFGGSKTLTIAEVLTGSFILRVVHLSKEGVYPTSIATEAATKTPAFWAWAQAVAAHPSVNGIYDEAAILENTKTRLANQRSA